jgi:DNA anti-recombination protein RmuC
MQELTVLRSQVSDLVTTVEALRAQLDTAREQVSQVREELPERLGDRLQELEGAPAAGSDEAPPTPARRSTRSSSSRTQRPKSGESS